MKFRFPVRLLVIDRSPAEAAGLVATLRRAKYDIKPHLVQKLEDVHKAVQGREWDLVLVGHELTDIPVTAVIDILKENDIDAPVIVLGDPGAAGQEASNAAIRAGVYDIVPRDEKLMLEHTVRRELAALDNRRLIENMKRFQLAEEQTLQWLVAHSAERLAITKGDDIIAANQAFLELFGQESQQFPWRNGLLDCVSAAEREELRAFLEAGGADRERPVQVELEGSHVTAGEFPLHLDIAPASFHGESGRRIVAVAQGFVKKEQLTITAAAAADNGSTQTETKLGNEPPVRSSPPLAVVKGGRTDSPDERPEEPGGAVVEIGNSHVMDRKKFLALIEDACRSIETRTDRIGIIYINLDDFSGLKGHVGIAGIEHVIETVIAMLKKLGPEGSQLARITDDDFALLVHADEWDDIVKAFRKIESGICGTVLEVGGRSIMVSAGAGLTGLLEEDNDAAAVLERAFSASLSELSPIVGVRAEPDEEDDSESSLKEMIDDLTEGMTDGRLFLVYQPIVRLRGKPLELYEVFMRFRNKQGEMVPPREFIDAAENAGFGIDLNLWLIEKTMQVLAEQHNQGRNTHLMIKVNEQALRDIRVPLAAGHGMKKLKFSPQQLIFEVCERASANQVKATRTMMHALRGLNCGTAIEHFGVTRKPFRLLEHVAVDYLTLDSTVVNNIARDENAINRVKYFSSRAHKIGKTTCAEYVDDAASVAILYDAGVDFMQGFYIQPPTPNLDFEFSMMVG